MKNTFSLCCVVAATLTATVELGDSTLDIAIVPLDA